MQNMYCTVAEQLALQVEIRVSVQYKVCTQSEISRKHLGSVRGVHLSPLAQLFGVACAYKQADPPQLVPHSLFKQVLLMYEHLYQRQTVQSSQDILSN